MHADTRVGTLTSSKVTGTIDDICAWHAAWVDHGTTVRHKGHTKLVSLTSKALVEIVSLIIIFSVV